jgi:hypothetical protein
VVLVTANTALEKRSGTAKTLLLGFIGLALFSSSVAAISHSTRISKTAGASGKMRTARAREADRLPAEEDLRRVNARLAQLELAARTKQEIGDDSPSPRGEAILPQQQPESPEEQQQHLEATRTEMDGRFDSQGARSSWSITKERELRTSISALVDSQGGRVRSLDCRESMCRMEVEHDNAKQALAFLDEMEFLPGMGDAHSTRLRLKPDEERYVFYVEPRKNSPNVISR